MKKNMRFKDISPKLKAGFTLLVLVLAFFIGITQSTYSAGYEDGWDVGLNSALGAAGATPGLPVTDVGAKTQTVIGRLLTKVGNKITTLWKAAGQKTFDAALRNTLNKVAFDAAKYIGSAGEGQKPLFVTEDFGSYILNLADAAGGDLIETLGKNWQVDLCQPADPNIKAKIGLGLTQYQKPQAPNCTLTQLTENYTSFYEKYKAMSGMDYLRAVQLSFDPGGGELNTSFELFNRLDQAKSNEKNDQILNLQVKQGWLDVTNVAGKLKNIPGYAQMNAQQQAQAKLDVIAQAKADNDPFIAAANIFLNQLSYEVFQRALRELGKTGKPVANNASDFFSAGIDYGETIVSEKLASVIKPRFDVRSDYSALSDLSICVDRNNPGPNNCVIDDKFAQAIGEKLTVGEALAKGYLHGDWLVTDNNKSDSAYTLRSASILRKFRVVPVGWEQAISKAAEKKIQVTFQDLVSCFDGNGPFSSNFNKNDQTWCRGLIDPNWVLKAPLTSCAKQGAGGQIITSLVSKDENGLSTVAISREGDYCADEQTCIKEKADGSCEVYGYCNEEKRTWNFSTDSCEPVYNTCQTFTNATSKSPVSYLENTLDFSTCDANNVGCKQYSYGGAYQSATGQVAWDKQISIFLNNQAKDCAVNGEGCTKLLRGKPGWQDVNFIMDSSFSSNNVGDTSTSTNWHWPIRNGVGAIIDGKALNISGANGAALYSDNNNSILPKGQTPISGWSYTLSADIMINSGDKVTMILGDNGNSSELSEKNAWKKVSVIVPADQIINNLDLAIVGSGGQVNFSVRNLKLTPNNFAPAYTNYAAFPVYEKLLPAYLESACYNSSSDYRLKSDAPAVCSNYARKCNRDEVGCELFTSLKDTFSIAAKANQSDYCDAQCIGYDTYLAKASYFYGVSADNLIPAKSKSCSAQSAGCASFTNLDASNQGGEKLEYYAKVRQCIKPDTASCGDFYSWDNSQLKGMSLKKDTGGNPYIVDPVADALCTKEIYNLPPTDPGYNPDCREFYNKSGQITYHLLSNTVSCSDNCHSYRLNEKNIDKDLTQATCTGADKNWDTAQGACYVCKNGGVWNVKQNNCLYQAIPEESATCSAEEVGCREYNGNNGNNLRLVGSYGFEYGVDGFTGNAAQSTESTAKNGHSLAINGTAQVDVQSFAKRDSAYVIKFIAKAANNTVVNISFENSSNSVSIFNATDNNPQGNLTVKGGNLWNLYEINLRNLDHEIKSEKLKIKSSDNLFIDNIIISEISDRYYLIKGSSNIPDVCYYDMSDKYQGPNYNLGCSQYKDRSGTINNLHQFSELCQDSAVGCEQMIQTYNSSDYFGYTVNLNGTDRKAPCTPGTFGCIGVKGHQAIYAVFDPTKQCNQADLGCSRFGYSQTTGNTTKWADAYKKNLPDNYNSPTASPLCQVNEVGCDSWTDENGSNSYFKDPGTNTCVFVDGTWYKSSVNRCDGNGDGKISGTEQNGDICMTDAECGSKKCITDSNKYDCKEITYLKTIGFGGAAGRVPTPQGAVGICSPSAATCGEYIDPESTFVSNLVYNPAAEDIDGEGSADKWTEETDGYYSQRISVKQNKLYILRIDSTNPVAQPIVKSVKVDNFSMAANGSGGKIRILGSTSTNELSDLVTQASTTSSVLFYTADNAYLTIHRYGTTTNATADKINVAIKEAIVNYQYGSNIDTTSCNGVVNPDGGCILFNARTQAGRSGLKPLIFDAYGTAKGAPQTCSGTNCSANQVIKVTPDRVCSRWLSCQTFTPDPITGEKTCYGMGECDQLNEKNECGNFLAVDGITRNISNAQNKNATGYSILNDYYIGGMKEVGQNTDVHFDFESNSVALSCRRDIDSGAPNTQCVFDKGISESLVLQPNGAPTDYPSHGKGYLKVFNSYQISPMSENSSISVYSNQDYYINYLVSTKGSNANAKMLITDDKGATTYVRFIEGSSIGWQRKVHSFRIPGNGKEEKKIKIYLATDSTDNSSGYVYFDDINIEPVLKIGTDNYVSKDCRLYPSDDSLSCLSANNNVIKDGLYGYCLQYDPLNPKVCLMWYPVDQISPITRNNQSNLGYSGKFPLYYCSEANGNFNLVEKIKVFEIYHDMPPEHGNPWQNWSSIQGQCQKHLGKDCPDVNTCYISDKAQINSGTTYVGDRDNTPQCGSDNYKLMANSIESSSGRYRIRYYCVPDPKKILAKTGEDTSVNKWLYEGQPGCNFQDSWVPFDGKFVSGPVYSADNNAGATDKEKTLETGNDMAFTYSSTSTLSVNNLQMLNPSDPQDYYHFNCNRFTQMVDNEGNNMAWAGRISRSSVFPTSTPDYFYNINSAYSYATGTRAILKFGRNREDIPFGAAILPSNFDFLNSDRVPLRNQFSLKNNETVLAGRPYSCSGSSCKYIGQCSMNNNVFCIYTGNTEVDKLGCAAGGNGQCVALWSDTPAMIPTAELAQKNILNKLFLKGYSDYSFNNNGYTAGSSYFMSNMDQCENNKRPSDPAGSFCKVYPSVTNTKMKLDGISVSITNDGGFAVEDGDLYALEFNSSVDVEQQPLKQIIIDWGDGNSQIITNTDNRPSGSPHVFYHYYPKKPSYKVRIKVIDNWGWFGCSDLKGMDNCPS